MRAEDSPTRHRCIDKAAHPHGAAVIGNDRNWRLHHTVVAFTGGV
jgi:hypothetical protein